MRLRSEIQKPLDKKVKSHPKIENRAIGSGEKFSNIGLNPRCEPGTRGPALASVPYKCHYRYEPHMNHKKASGSIYGPLSPGTRKVLAYDRMAMPTPVKSPIPFL